MPAIFFSYSAKDGFRVKGKVSLFLLAAILLLALGAVGTYTLSQPSALTLEAEKQWETYGVGGTCVHGSHNFFVADVDGDGVCAWNVGTGDLDNDRTVEIVTVGCMGINRLCDPDMRIWSIPNSLPIGYIIAVAVSATFTVMVGTYLFTKKSQK